MFHNTSSQKTGFSKNKTLFMEAFKEATSGWPEDICRVWKDSVSIELLPVDDEFAVAERDEVYLETIRAFSVAEGVRSGNGGKALDFITSLADQFSITIKVHSEPLLGCSMTQSELNEFYKRRGFVLLEGPHNPMERKPNSF